MRNLAILCFCLSSTPIWAADLLLYDGFNYSPGQLLVQPTDNGVTPTPGHHNVAYNVDWRYAGTGGTNTNAPGVKSGSLSVTGLPAPTGNSVAFDMTQTGAARIGLPAAISSGTIYWSAIVQMNNTNTLSSSTTTGALIAGLNNTTGSSGVITGGGSILLVKKAQTDPGNTDYELGTGVSTNNSDRTFDSTPLQQGVPVFVVGSYQFVGTAAHDDIARMWINPASSSFGVDEASKPAESLISQNGAGADLAGVSSLFLRNISTVGNFDFQLDELRIGTTWASVTAASTSPGVQGDYNGNGVVDAADYVLWRNGGPLQNEVASGGTVDSADYDAWRARFGNTSGSGAGLVASEVPEPTSLACAILAGVTLSFTLRRRSREMALQQ